ncbi:MAG: hypothetical protein JWM33_1693 [Caulobacteraceae bacterium]|nr:hypothetical protein [Caulobacteraceae bacterium]
MADAFERELTLMLDEPPALDGEDAFADAIEARIEKAWRIRRWGLGLAALAGAGVTVAALVRTPPGLSALFADLAGSAAQGDNATWLAAACLAALLAVVLPRVLAEP